jgi:hypothetical protein
MYGSFRPSQSFSGDVDPVFGLRKQIILQVLEVLGGSILKTRMETGRYLIFLNYIRRLHIAAMDC